MTIFNVLFQLENLKVFITQLTKSYFGNSKLNQKKLNEAWEHWRHKVLDYLNFKKKISKKISYC